MQQLWEQIHAGTVEEPDSSGGPPLLERVIKEAMRVLPASAYSVRMNVQREQLGPLDLPPGTPIVFTPLITHRLEASFPDPTRFDPDRWLTINPSPYAYHPFGAGPRRCIGGPLAMEVLRTSLPIFLRDWRLTVVPDAEVSAEVKSTMLNPEARRAHGRRTPRRLAPGRRRLPFEPRNGERQRARGLRRRRTRAT